MVKSCCRTDDKTGLRKGLWSLEEDQKLKAYINRYGIWNWAEMPKAAGLLRGGKSCRLRWMNYLRPGIKHGNFSQEEDETIINLHQQLGNRWSIIASKVPGRTDNEIKNHWHTTLKKYGLKHNLEEVPTPNLQGTQTDNINVTQKNPSEEDDLLLSGPPIEYDSNYYVTIQPLMSPQLSIDSFSSSPSNDSASEIYNNQTIEENNVSSGSTYDELQNLWDLAPESPILEGLCKVDDCGKTYTNPGFCVATPQVYEFQENTYTVASDYSDGDDLWNYLLMEANEDQSLTTSFFY